MPDKREQEWIMEAIQNDLQKYSVPKRTISLLVKDVEKLKKQGAEGVVLGCTDLPVAITERNCSVPLFDLTVIHVKATLDHALGTVK